jgi:hypothetical protein
MASVEVAGLACSDDLSVAMERAVHAGLNSAEDRRLPLPRSWHLVVFDELVLSDATAFCVKAIGW